NGAGKTTAMRTILGLSTPDAGEVRWNGKPIGRDERLRFGYLPEERGLYPKMAVAEQLVYLARLHGAAPAAAKAATEQWLERLGVADRAGARLDTLSLGNQQRVQLAAALVHDPELLILDEPFSGLDPVAVETLAGVLGERAAAGVGVLFSSHQLDLVEDLCEAVTIIHRGSAVVTGAVSDLQAGGPPRLDVEVDGQDGGAWARGLPGAQVEAVEGARVRLVLDAGAEPQAVLRAAMAAGPVREFAVVRRRLSEVFRDAVNGTAPARAEAGRGGPSASWRDGRSASSSSPRRSASPPLSSWPPSSPSSSCRPLRRTIPSPSGWGWWEPCRRPGATRSWRPAGWRM
ncbi:MAG: ABC transporter ATP-binding protein, partial [Acidimicrobiales bacterium]